MTAVLFGDVEDATMTWLAAGLTEYVGDRAPTKEQLPGLVVIRLGGPQTSIVTEDATVTLEAWSQPGLWKPAHDLILRARQRIHDIRGQRVNGLTFYLVNEFAGPGRLVDPETRCARYVMTVSIRVRCT